VPLVGSAVHAHLPVQNRQFGMGVDVSFTLHAWRCGRVQSASVWHLHYPAWGLYSAPV